MTDGPPPRHLHPVYDEPPPYDDSYEPPPPDDRRTTNDPPADRAAELALLAALINNPDQGTDIAALLDPDDLYWPIHRDLWDAWHTTTQTDGTPPDAVTLNAHLIATKNVEAVRTLADLFTSKASPIRAPAYAKTIRDKARLRTVAELGARFRQLVTNVAVDQVDSTLAEALQTLDETVMRFGPTQATTNTGLADLSWVLEGTPPTAEPPVWGIRTDGTALFYDGRHNGVFGDPESGKTWLAQVAGVEAMNAGHCFAMIDVDHNGQNHTAARLTLLGARFEHIADPTRFRYYEPEDADQLRAAVRDITALVPAVVVLDSIGEILPMLGVKSVDNDEITAALREVVMPPAKAGSCVISVDHLPKSAEARVTGYAIGGTAKKRAIDGAYLRAEAKQKPTPGGIGRIMLRIEKDRTGELRKSSGGGYAGTFTIDSTQPNVTTWTIGQERAPTNEDGTFRPTGYMEKVAAYVADHDGCTQNEIEVDVPGTAKHIRAAVDALVADGHIIRTPGKQRRRHHTLVIPYREAEDDRAQPSL